MIDSPVFAEFVEEGRALGLAQGRLEALRDSIVAALETRFGPVPLAITMQVDRLTDVARASVHFRRALVAESLEVFAQELAAANP